ncbi:unnamed protein product [Clonostachys rosea]|uniref:Aminotransferase class V domain-containing protein n=1 Tax=Bionectria ochroleuca TaxID=29856 RepID=A0ABY6UKG2_BIOOC|nr:unnamed protein product [Clonostachys rosea]
MVPATITRQFSTNVEKQAIGLRSSPNPLPTIGNDFEVYRRLVPLVLSGTTIHLNAGFMPPSNLIVHQALSQFNNEALNHPSPKPEWKKTVEEARKLVGRYIQTDPSNIAFVRDTTEGLGSFMHGLDFEPGDNVVILDCEHPNQMYGWLSMRDRGLEVRLVPTHSDKPFAANASTFAPYVNDRTRAIGLSSVMFHNGQLNDIADICTTYRPRGIHVLGDLTQQVGFTDINVESLGVSAAAFSLHKGLNTPTGFAVLYVDPKVISAIDPVPPLVSYGGVTTTEDAEVSDATIQFHPNARRYEHTNMSFSSAVCARAFLEFYLDFMGPKNVEKHLYELGDALREVCRDLDIGILGPEERENHSPHLYVLRLHDGRWGSYLRKGGVIVTSLRTGIRVSFGFYNNTTDVRVLGRILAAGIKEGLEL